MKVSEHWLREWVNPDGDTDAIAAQLTMAGLEVDGITAAAPPLDGVVVGKVLEKEQHPNADRLSVCKVDVGAGQPLQIVCGAANVYAGGTFPVATIGTTLPGDFKIKKSKLRGEESQGMLCSGVELGITEDAEGLLELDGDLQPGVAVSEALGLDDRIIELDLTPNRADCFSMLGIARDLAAVNGLAFNEPKYKSVKADIKDQHPVAAAAKSGCPVFAGRVMRGVDPQAESPLWLQERLRRAGIRPLGAIVDVTNYVMLELGQPMHAYDLSKLSGTVHARQAKQGEKLTLLDGQEVTLDDDVLVIADDNGAVGMAGIMGGSATAVGDDTTDLLLESAFFTPASIAGRARRFGLHTDASLRFERGVDFKGQQRAIERATALIQDIAGGAAGPVVTSVEKDALPARSPVKLRRTQLDRLLGITVDDATVRGMFELLGFRVADLKTGWKVTPTSARFDIEIEADLIEEVVRLYGYDKVPDTRLQGEARPASHTETRVPLIRAAQLLADRGYSEAITYSFVEPTLQTQLLGEAEELSLVNPISAEQSVMRRSLWPGLLSAAKANRQRQQSRVRLFENGVIFTLQGNEISEKNIISGVVWGQTQPEHWSDASGAQRNADFFDVKSDLDAVLALADSGVSPDYVASEHPALRPGRTARIERDGKLLGWLGELHPRVARKLGISGAPVLFELLTEQALAARVPHYQPVSRFPSVRRDLAVIVAESVTAGDLVKEVGEAAGPLLQEVKVFDVYRGDSIENGLKSVALGLILQETSRTLTELEIDDVINTVITRLSSKFNASIRE